MLDIVESYHYMQSYGKLSNQIWGNGKKPRFGTNFDTFGPNFGPNLFFIDSASTSISSKTNEPNFRK